jgi:hypothetical protein
MVVAALSILSLGTVRRLLGASRDAFYGSIVAALVCALFAAVAFLGWLALP